MGTNCWWALAASLAVVIGNDREAFNVHAVFIDDIGEPVDENGALEAELANGSLVADDAFAGSVVLLFDLSHTFLQSDAFDFVCCFH